MGFNEWLNRLLGIGYGEETHSCPRCAGQLFVRKMTREGGQVVTCPYCGRDFRLVIHQGQGLRTEIPGDAP